ncbi:MAG: type II toxin-antitoxin system RelE/ParE family toxin [Bacteroidota bacterium]
MSRYVITGPARRDLEDIFDYLAETDPAAALRLDDRLLKAFRQLAELPQMGRSQEHRRPPGTSELDRPALPRVLSPRGA